MSLQRRLEAVSRAVQARRPVPGVVTYLDAVREVCAADLEGREPRPMFGWLSWLDRGSEAVGR